MHLQAIKSLFPRIQCEVARILFGVGSYEGRIEIV